MFLIATCSLINSEFNIYNKHYAGTMHDEAASAFVT